MTTELDKTMRFNYMLFKYFFDCGSNMKSLLDYMCTYIYTGKREVESKQVVKQNVGIQDSKSQTQI